MNRLIKSEHSRKMSSTVIDATHSKAYSNHIKFLLPAHLSFKVSEKENNFFYFAKDLPFLARDRQTLPFLTSS